MSDVSYVIAYVCSKVIPPPACVLTNNTEVGAGSACSVMQVSILYMAAYRQVRHVFLNLWTLSSVTLYTHIALNILHCSSSLSQTKTLACVLPCKNFASISWRVTFITVALTTPLTLYCTLSGSIWLISCISILQNHTADLLTLYQVKCVLNAKWCFLKIFRFSAGQCNKDESFC